MDFWTENLFQDSYRSKDVDVDEADSRSVTRQMFCGKSSKLLETVALAILVIVWKGD